MTTSLKIIWQTDLCSTPAGTGYCADVDVFDFVCSRALFYRIDKILCAVEVCLFRAKEKEGAYHRRIGIYGKPSSQMCDGYGKI